MSKEFIRSYAEMRAPNNILWMDAIMNYAAYSCLTLGMLVVLATCGHALYELSLLAWPL
jgi:hypothetical protein